MLERQETASFLKSPEKCLYSESFKEVNKIRVSKAAKASGSQQEASPVKAKPEKAKKAGSDDDAEQKNNASSQVEAKVRPRQPGVKIKIFPTLIS